MDAGEMLRTVCGGLLAVMLVGGCGAQPPTTPHTAGAPLVSTDDLPAAQPGDVHLLAFNDFHGNLLPPSGEDGEIAGQQDGGAGYFAAHLGRLRAAYPNSVVLSAGDNIGASPMTSSMFHDEPTIKVLNQWGVAASAVGNHEFDKGVGELQRIAKGGCRPEGCTPGETYTGATFDYLAANVTNDKGELPPGTIPWKMVQVAGHKIGVVGVVTPATAKSTLPDGIRGYSFGDEATAINARIPEMKVAGAQTIVALVHDGGNQGSAHSESDAETIDDNGCDHISPNLPQFASAVDPAVSVLITGHTHQPYVCHLAGKLVTQAASYGRLISDITMHFSGDTVDRVQAVNRAVTHNVPQDPNTSTLVNFYDNQTKAAASRQVGTAAAEISKAPESSGESPLGDVIADDMLQAGAPAGASIAFMNPGGIREDIGAGPITYGEIYAAQPFGNQFTTAGLTGSQIRQILEQQFAGPTPYILDESGLTYSYDPNAPIGHKTDPNSVRVAGGPLVDTTVYRVTTNNYLSTGGDGFTQFAQATAPTPGPTDLQALETYLHTHPNLTPPPPRIHRR